MICQECNNRPATLHFAKIINGDKTEFHLCEQCAGDKSDMFIFPESSGFSINNLLAGLLNISSLNEAKPNTFPQNDVVQCENCKMTFKQFTKVGKFGCSNCYKAFERQLHPILKRLHGGNTSHTGKVPKRIGGTIHSRKQLEQLKLNLKELITNEEFEKAAEIRDQIRALERELDISKEGER